MLGTKNQVQVQLGCPLIQLTTHLSNLSWVSHALLVAQRQLQILFLITIEKFKVPCPFLLIGYVPAKFTLIPMEIHCPFLFNCFHSTTLPIIFSFSLFPHGISFQGYVGYLLGKKNSKEKKIKNIFKNQFLMFRLSKKKLLKLIKKIYTSSDLTLTQKQTKFNKN